MLVPLFSFVDQPLKSMLVLFCDVLKFSLRVGFKLEQHGQWITVYPGIVLNIHLPKGSQRAQASQYGH